MTSKVKRKSIPHRGILTAIVLLGLVLATSGTRVHGDFHQDPPPDYEVPPGYEIVEGDMLVPIGSLKPGTTYCPLLWPGGMVPYEFDGNVSAENQTRMVEAMAEWEAVASVDFVPRSDQDDYVHIQASSQNNSMVGFQGSEQIINIVSWDAKFIMAHELGHCLGYLHEQSRADRDNYVLINWDHVCQDCCGDGEPCDYNFEMREDGCGEYGPYDFDSVMHYDECAFSACGRAGCEADPASCRTITVLPPNQQWQSVIGQKDHLSYLDRTTMSFLYPQSGWRFVDDSNPFEGNGTFFEPYNDFKTAVANTPTGGTLWVQPGYYSAVGTYSRAMTIRAPLGNVTLAN